VVGLSAGLDTKARGKLLGKVNGNTDMYDVETDLK
jgi:hypothetical protein